MKTLELAQRKQDGLEVTLYWNALSHEIWIALVDERTESACTFDVEPKSALDAFYHPYAYAPEPELVMPAMAATDPRSQQPIEGGRR